MPGIKAFLRILNLDSSAHPQSSHLTTPLWPHLGSPQAPAPFPLQFLQILSRSPGVPCSKQLFIEQNPLSGKTGTFTHPKGCSISPPTFVSFFVFSPGFRAALLLLLGASIPVQMTDDTVPLFVHTLVFGYSNLLLEKAHLEFAIRSPSLV